MKKKEKLLKSEKLRMKHDKLRAAGKYPKKKRWSGKLINSGLGSFGMNLGTPGGDPMFNDRTGAIIEESKNNRKE